MPELPEVEMIVRDLQSKIVGRRILGVQTDWPKYLRLPSSEAGFRACISGKVITAVDRRSKNGLISLTGDYVRYRKSRTVFPKDSIFPCRPIPGEGGDHEWLLNANWYFEAPDCVKKRSANISQRR